MVASGKSALKVQYPMLCHCQPSFHFRRQKIDAHSLRIALANWRRQISCPLYPRKQTSVSTIRMSRGAAIQQ